MTRTQRLRRSLEKAAQLPQDADAYDYPLESLAGWSKSPGDPEMIVAATEVTIRKATPEEIPRLLDG